MFGRLGLGSTCVFDLQHLPLDGRTMRSVHFETIWRVFGFPMPILPAQAHGLALADLAAGRNEVAHGRTDPVAFGRHKAAVDVSRLVGKVEDVIIHLIAASDAYISQKLYLR